MASWLRAAEELFEVVDRKAKQVVVRPPEDTQLSSQTSALEPGVLNRLSSAISTEKGNGRSSRSTSTPIFNPASKASPVEGDGRRNEPGQSDGKAGIFASNLREESSTEQEKAYESSPLLTQSGGSGAGSSFAERGESEIQDDEPNSDSGKEVYSSHRVLGQAEIAVPNGEAILQNDGDGAQNQQQGSLENDNSFDESSGTTVGAFIKDSRNSLEQNGQNGHAGSLEESGSPRSAAELDVDGLVDLVPLGRPNAEELAVLLQPEGKSNASEGERPPEVTEIVNVQEPAPPVANSSAETVPAVEDQLNEADQNTAILEDYLSVQARGLLAVAAPSGNSREARLAKVCSNLSSRLQEYKAENKQLEQLLLSEREERKSFDARMQQGLQELAAFRASAAGVESDLEAALALKNAEIEELSSTVDNFRRQAAVAEGKLAALQATTETMTKNRDITETRMIQALRSELATAERRVEEERIAYASSRHAAVERETELEQRVAESNTALMRMQRAVDERTHRAAELEQQLSMLEVECATLNQELQDREARQRREQKPPSEEAGQTAQVWRKEAERAREVHRDSESKLVAMEAEMQKLRVELAGLKREQQLVTSQAQLELEKRFQQSTELLYHKQSQLEVMSSEKAAALLQLEQARRLLVKAEAEKPRNFRNSSLYGEDDELKPFELSLGLHQRRLGPVGPSFQRAAKFLDFSAVTAGRFLWRRPLARLFAFFYLVFIHIFLMYVIHRLQEQADRPSSREELEAAKAAGILLGGAP